jgi:hypothetical protein
MLFQMLAGMHGVGLESEVSDVGEQLHGSMDCLALHKKGLFAGGWDGTLRHIEVLGDQARILNTYPVDGAPISHIAFNATHHKMLIGSNKASAAAASAAATDAAAAGMPSSETSDVISHYQVLGRDNNVLTNGRSSDYMILYKYRTVESVICSNDTRDQIKSRGAFIWWSQVYIIHPHPCVFRARCLWACQRSQGS